MFRCLFSCFLLVLGIGGLEGAGLLTSGGGAVFPGHEFLRALDLSLWSVRGDGFASFREGKPLGAACSVDARLPLSSPFAPGTGRLHLTRSADGSRYTHRVSFDARQHLSSCCAVVALDSGVLAGREYLLLPSLERRMFPVQASSHRLALFSGSGIAIALGRDRYLCIFGECAGREVKVVDGRTQGFRRLEVRFSLGVDRPLPGVDYEGGVRFHECSRRALEGLCAARKPEAGKESLLFAADGGGVCTLIDGEETLMTLKASLYGRGWSYVEQNSRAFRSRTYGNGVRFYGDLKIPHTPEERLHIGQNLALGQEPATAHLDYSFALDRPVTMNQSQISFSLENRHYRGSQLRLSGPSGEKVLVLGKAVKDKKVFEGQVTSFQVSGPLSRRSIRVEFTRPVQVLVEDNRSGWRGDTTDVLVCLHGSAEGQSVPAGRDSVAFTFRGGDKASGMRVVTDSRGMTSVTDTSSWFPYELAWDRPCPVDMSFLNGKRAAGSGGFIGVRDGRFVTLGNGRDIRFWGICFSAGANFPTHAQAEKIAKRVASYGINIVRTHHADASWAENNLFPRGADNTRSFDRENLDRFDYLIYCLKREGVYIYLDQLVHRKFLKGDGVANVEKLPTAGKPYCYFDPRLIELQKEYSRALWTHVNPYTKLAYKDDPAIAMMEFVNENDLFSQPVVLEPYRTRFEEMYREWASQQGIVLPTGKIDFRTWTDPMVRFFIQVQDDFYREMGDYLRGLGVKVPMTGSNWPKGPRLLLSLEKLDYTDTHNYWNHPRGDRSYGTNSMLSSCRTIMGGMGAHRLKGKPFFVSEWDAPWPYEYRAELPVWLASVAAFQDWNGLTGYTYRHWSAPVDYLKYPFDMFNDPARFGLFPHAALIFRRGDVAPGKTLRRVTYQRRQSASLKASDNWQLEGFAGLECLNRFSMEFDDKGEGVLDCGRNGVVDGDRHVSEGGEIRRDLQRGMVSIATERSQAISAFFSGGTSYEAGGLRVTLPVPRFGTIAVSSLTEAPIASSPRVLLTVVGRVENTGFAYSLMRNRQQVLGHAPVLCEPLKPLVELRIRQGAQVHPVTDHGKVLSPLPSEWKDGVLRFRCDYPTIYYLIR